MARLTRRPLFLIALLLLAISLLPLPVLPQENKAIKALVNENYRRADRAIQETSDPVKQLFFRGILHFEREEYGQARSSFEKLIDRFPETPRAEDASYYLDRLKLYSSTQPPWIGVELARSDQLTGSVDGLTVASRRNGETITLIQPDQSWTVEKGYFDSTKLIVAGESYSLGKDFKLNLRSKRDGSHLRHNERPYRGRFIVEKNGNQFRLINKLRLNDYLYGVVRKEIAPGWPRETIKAQSVAARSFALSKIEGDTDSFDLKSNHLAQVYGGVNAETRRVREAVDATRGEVLTYNNKVIPAYFHANSGGYIETASNVWKHGKTPFIVSKRDTWSKNTRHASWSASLARSVIRTALSESKFPSPSSGFSLKIEERLPSGRTKSISYPTGYQSRKRLSASEFRMTIGPNKLKSTWIESIEHNHSTITFKGRGWGHGIGMSQWGAHAMGESGLTYRRILSFYYERAKLMGQYGLGTNREGK